MATQGRGLVPYKQRPGDVPIKLPFGEDAQGEDVYVGDPVYIDSTAHAVHLWDDIDSATGMWGVAAQQKDAGAGGDILVWRAEPGMLWKCVSDTAAETTANELAGTFVDFVEASIGSNSIGVYSGCVFDHDSSLEDNLFCVKVLEEVGYDSTASGVYPIYVVQIPHAQLQWYPSANV